MPGLLGGHVLILAKFFVQRQKHVHCSVKQSWLPVLLPVACSEIISATGHLQKRTGRKWLGNTERGAGLGQDGPVLTVHDTTGYGVPTFRRRQAASCAATHTSMLAIWPESTQRLPGCMYAVVSLTVAQAGLAPPPHLSRQIGSEAHRAMVVRWGWRFATVVEILQLPCSRTYSLAYDMMMQSGVRGSGSGDRSSEGRDTEYSPEEPVPVPGIKKAGSGCVCTRRF